MTEFLVYSAGKKIELPSQVFKVNYLEMESDIVAHLLKTKAPLLLLDESWNFSFQRALPTLSEKIKDIKILLLVKDKNHIEGHLEDLHLVEAIIEKGNDMAIRESIFRHFHLFDLFGVLEQRLIAQLEQVMTKKLQSFSLQSLERELIQEMVQE